MKFHGHIVAFFITLFAINAYAMQPNDQPSDGIVTRLWHSIFGKSPQQTSSTQTPCPNCQNNPGGNHIDNAYITNGGNQSSNSSGTSSPTYIKNLHGQPGYSGGPSDEALIAIEKEKTRQLELANAQNLQIEHERNKWFNTLALFIKEAVEEFSSKQSSKDLNLAISDDLKKEAKEALDTHHQFLEKLEKKRGKNELEKERIRQENLPIMLEHDLTKTKLLHEQAKEKLTLIGKGLHTFTGDKKRMTATALTLSGLALGIYASKRGTLVVADYASSLLMKPNLVTETSRRSLNQFLRHPIKSVRRTQEKLPLTIYNDSLQHHITKYVASIKASQRNGQPLRHGLFYGAPGTGKTLLAKTIAKELGFDYAIIAGPNIYQFTDQDGVKEMNKLFDWAERSRKKVVLFIDEVDALAPSRLNGTVSEQTRKIQNAFYARTGTETNKFLLVSATNMPNLLDSAFLSRMDERIEFPLPDKQTRATLLKQFFTMYVTNGAHIQVKPDIREITDWVVERTEGFSGRDISQLVRAFPAEVYALKYSDDKRLTASMIQRVVHEHIEQREALKNYKEAK